MGCQGIPLATRGYIYCPETTIIEGDSRCVLPFKVKFNRDLFSLNLRKQDTTKINSLLTEQTINFRLCNMKINNKFPNLKINIKKCKD